VCAVGSGPGNMVARARFPTTSPEETLEKTIAFFQNEQAKAPIRAVGLGSFGPLDLDPLSPTYGYITATPKTGWFQVNIAGALQQALEIPVAVDTDVNAAALGEYRWGAGRDLDNLVYLTVGTGIGGGGIINGRLLHGLIHPEMGHIRIPHDTEVDPFAGSCPYHGDCLEGLASGTAIEKRWGRRGEDLPADHPAWHLEARYLACGLMNIICTLSPARIIIGGGVMKQPALLPEVRRQVQVLLNSYIASPQITRDINSYIVPPGLGDLSGISGALALAQSL